MSDWLRLLLWVPDVFFLIRSLVDGWKLVDEVNAAVPWPERYRHFGRDPVRAWEKHEELFPARKALRKRIRRSGLAGWTFLAVALCLSIWIPYK
jgi:hypothetical protein